MTPTHPVFIISDTTGSQPRSSARCLLLQFPGEAFASEGLFFVDALAKAEDAANRIRDAWKVSSLKLRCFRLRPGRPDPGTPVLDSSTRPVEVIAALLHQSLLKN